MIGQQSTHQQSLHLCCAYAVHACSTRQQQNTHCILHQKALYITPFCAAAALRTSDLMGKRTEAWHGSLATYAPQSHAWWLYAPPSSSQCQPVVRRPSCTTVMGAPDQVPAG